MNLADVLKFDPYQPRDYRGRWIHFGISAPKTKEFKQWFGGSKVVDELGRPMAVYHGSFADIEEFRHDEHSKSVQGGQLGFHFGTADAANERIALSSDFDAVVGRETKPSVVYPVFLSIQNPLRLPDLASVSAGYDMDEYAHGEQNRLWEDPDNVAETLLDEKIIDIDEFEEIRGDFRSIVAHLKAKGYDGIVYRNAVEDRGSDSWIAFDAEQIKSATGNEGAYNRKDKRITKSLIAILKVNPNVDTQPRGENGRWIDAGGGAESSTSDEESQRQAKVHIAVKLAAKSVLADYKKNGLENAVLIGPNGEKLFAIEGGTTGVYFTDDEMDKIQPGMHLIHNHPKPYSLSNGDLFAAASKDITIYAVDTDGGEYSAKAIEDAISAIGGAEYYMTNLMKEYERIAAPIRREMDLMNLNSSFSVEARAELVDLYQHFVLLEMRNRGLFEYNYKLGAPQQAAYEKYRDQIDKKWGTPEEQAAATQREYARRRQALGESRAAASKSLVEILKFDPQKHPRHPAGSDEGGRFAPRGMYLQGAKPSDKTLSKVSIRRAGNTWEYSDGKPLEPELVARLKKVGTPPGWKDVYLNADPNGACQVIGTDEKGKRQYRLSAEHNTKAAADKFSRLKAFHEALPGIRKAVNAAILKDGPDRDVAEILYLIDKTGFRIGGEGDTGADVQAYGATTLLGKHVVVSDDLVTFTFIGKKGVRIVKRVRDQRLAKIMRIRERNTLESEQLFDTVSDDQARRYLKRISGQNFLVKDFRTWHGTNLALKLVKGNPVPANAKEFKEQRRMVAKAVAAHLGNTPAVALSAYIDPAVFKRWEGAAP